MKNRSGMTLIEVVGMLTLIGTLLSTSTIVINRSFNAHRSALTHLRKMHSLEQFVQRWRYDIHACQHVSIDDQLELITSDHRRIQYAAKDYLVTRIQFDGDSAIGQETWELPNHCQLTWQLKDSGAQQLLIGELSFDNTSVAKNSIALEPLALIARVGIANVPGLADRRDATDSSATGLRESQND